MMAKTIAMSFADCWTNAVVASLVELSPAGCVGAVGAPVRAVSVKSLVDGRTLVPSHHSSTFFPCATATPVPATVLTVSEYAPWVWFETIQLFAVAGTNTEMLPVSVPVNFRLPEPACTADRVTFELPRTFVVGQAFTGP